MQLIPLFLGHCTWVRRFAFCSWIPCGLLLFPILFVSALAFPPSAAPSENARRVYYYTYEICTYSISSYSVVGILHYGHKWRAWGDCETRELKIYTDGGYNGCGLQMFLLPACTYPNGLFHVQVFSLWGNFDRRKTLDAASVVQSRNKYIYLTCTLYWSRILEQFLLFYIYIYIFQHLPWCFQVSATNPWVVYDP